MRHDSPVEYTGTAHLVSRSCATCEDSFEQPETEAEYQTNNDIPPICSECLQRIEDLWSDTYIRDQVERIRLMADMLEAYDYVIEADALRQVSRHMETLEPLIRAVNRCDSLSNREAFERHIERYD